MKWDSKTKQRLSHALEDHFSKMIRRSLHLRSSGIPPIREEFLGRHSIKTALRLTGKSGWPCWYFLENGQYEKAQSKDRIVIEDPWGHAVLKSTYISRVQKKLLSLHHDGISIPKETAEKMLVLGIP